jgi:hypothetical protein
MYAKPVADAEEGRALLALGYALLDGRTAAEVDAAGKLRDAVHIPFRLSAKRYDAAAVRRRPPPAAVRRPLGAAAAAATAAEIGGALNAAPPASSLNPPFSSCPRKRTRTERDCHNRQP